MLNAGESSTTSSTKSNSGKNNKISSTLVLIVFTSILSACFIIIILLIIFLFQNRKEEKYTETVFRLRTPDIHTVFPNAGNNSSITPKSPGTEMNVTPYGIDSYPESNIGTVNFLLERK